jgi:hypothetical protein
MKNGEFIKYLNTLHNVGAKNENAIAEASKNSPFYKDLLVKRPVVDVATKWLTEQDPHMILITGHAGDGKTSLLIQILDYLGGLNGALKDYDEVKLSNGTECVYIKDFSEFSDENRVKLLEDCLEKSKTKHVIIVANTGPLINTFKEVLGKEVEKDILDVIDINSEDVKEIKGYKIRALNFASIDNSSFAGEYLKKIISHKSFEDCRECSKKDVCPIYFNRELVIENVNKVTEFLYNHYVWQQEHGKRLTIRQIIAQITYSLTAGLECEDVDGGSHREWYLFNHLFSNTLFGYKGINPDRQALAIKAISDIHQNRYDHKTLIHDEALFILQDYRNLHSKVQNIVSVLNPRYTTKNVLEWKYAVRRMCILFNIETDPEKNYLLQQNIFSNKFPRYMELRDGKLPNNDDKALIMEAFSIMHTGYKTQDNREIPITLKRSDSIDQSVQLLYCTISSRDVRLITESTGSLKYGEGDKKQLFITVGNRKIDQPITLPLLNYFDDISNGAIPTNIDPMLSHGIDSIKAKMLSVCNPNHEDRTIEMLVMSVQGWNSIVLQEDSDGYILSSY